MKIRHFLVLNLAIGCILLSLNASAKPKIPEAIQKISWMQGHWTCDQRISVSSKKGKIEKHNTAKYIVTYEPKTKSIKGIWNSKDGSSTLHYGYDSEKQRYEIAVIGASQTEEPSAGVIQMGNGQLTSDGIKFIGKSFYQDYVNKYTKTFHLIDDNHYHTIITTDNDAVNYHVVADINCAK